MKRIIIFVSLVILVLGCASCGSKAAETTKDDSLDQFINACEEGGWKVTESIISSDGCYVALLAEHIDYEYQQLFVYGKDPSDLFVPFFEPQVFSGGVTAAEGGGFTVEGVTGTFFVEKSNNGWHVSGNNAPLGTGPADPE